MLADAGKADEALTHLTRFLELKPSGPAAYERLANLLRQAGRADAVPGTLARLAEANPTNETIRWVLASELARDNPAAAARLFGELSEKAADPEFFRRLVRFQKDAGRLKDLLDTADQLLGAAKPRKGPDPKAKATPADPTAVDRARAFVVAVKAEPGLTEPLVRQATAEVQRTTRTPDTWELVAALAERDGQLDLRRGAVEGCQPGRRDGGRAGLPASAGQATEVGGDQDRGDGDDRPGARAKGRQGRPERPLFYEVYQATAYAELGEGAAALDLIQRGVVEQVQVDGKPSARRQKAVILNILGRHAEAVKECLDVMAEFPDSINETRYVLSNSYLGLKEYAKAEAELRAVLEDDPDDELALNNLGYNLADQGRNLAEAEAMIRRAIEIDRYERAKPAPRAGERHVPGQPRVGAVPPGQAGRGAGGTGRAAKLPDAASDAVVWDHLGDVSLPAGGQGRGPQGVGEGGGAVHRLARRPTAGPVARGSP